MASELQISKNKNLTKMLDRVLKGSANVTVDDGQAIYSGYNPTPVSKEFRPDFISIGSNDVRSRNGFSMRRSVQERSIIGLDKTRNS